MDLLKSRNKTPEEAAKVLGVSERAFYYWLAGKREPKFSIAQIQDFCDWLQCSVHEIPRDFSRLKTSADRADDTIGADFENGGN